MTALNDSMSTRSSPGPDRIALTFTLAQMGDRPFRYAMSLFETGRLTNLSVLPSCIWVFRSGFESYPSVWDGLFGLNT